jgi:hypothetical protein
MFVLLRDPAHPPRVDPRAPFSSEERAARSAWQLVETRDDETGAWRGTVQDGKTS